MVCDSNPTVISPESLMHKSPHLYLHLVVIDLQSNNANNSSRALCGIKVLQMQQLGQWPYPTVVNPVGSFCEKKRKKLY